MRLQSSASDIWSDHQRLIDFLELLAGNEPQNIGQHDEGNDKSENQTPRRHMRADVQQERRIGPRNRNRTIHIVNGESGHWQAPIFRLITVPGTWICRFMLAVPSLISHCTPQMMKP